MKRWLIALAIFLAVASPAAAQDFKAGEKAFLDANYELAKIILMPLARSGDAEAQYLVGVMYAHGRGFPAICRQAARWYRKAAEQGHAEASFSLGFLYYYGYGQDQDECMLRANPERAAPWLKQAAELGVPRAQRLVGRMYSTGVGLPLSADKGFEWTGKAAENGGAEARYDLALLHAGTGNRVDSYALFQILAEQGYPGALINMGRLEENMSGDELERARAKADSLRAGE